MAAGIIYNRNRNLPVAGRTTRFYKAGDRKAFDRPAHIKGAGKHTHINSHGSPKVCYSSATGTGRDWQCPLAVASGIEQDRDRKKPAGRPVGWLRRRPPRQYSLTVTIYSSTALCSAARTQTAE